MSLVLAMQIARYLGTAACILVAITAMAFIVAVVRSLREPPISSRDAGPSSSVRRSRVHHAFLNGRRTTCRCRLGTIVEGTGTDGVYAWTTVEADATCPRCRRILGLPPMRADPSEDALPMEASPGA